MFSKVYNYNPSASVYSDYFLFICIFVTVTCVTHNLLLFNVLKPYNSSCIEINSNILMALIFSVFLTNNE